MIQDDFRSDIMAAEAAWYKVDSILVARFVRGARVSGKPHTLDLDLDPAASELEATGSPIQSRDHYLCCELRRVFCYCQVR